MSKRRKPQVKKSEFIYANLGGVLSGMTSAIYATDASDDQIRFLLGRWVKLCRDLRREEAENLIKAERLEAWMEESWMVQIRAMQSQRDVYGDLGERLEQICFSKESN
jgi:hypothetical protein